MQNAASLCGLADKVEYLINKNWDSVLGGFENDGGPIEFVVLIKCKSQIGGIELKIIRNSA